MPLVSLVTPVHNGERYLAECIESVLHQTFVDWEYVIVDNCSSDRSLAIAESYTRDKRVRVHSFKEFLPVTASFNRAASLVSPHTRYLKFVCADDLLFPDCLRMMVDLAESTPTINLVGSYWFRGQKLVCDAPPYPQEVIRGKDVCRSFFQLRLGLLGSETTHLIRRPKEITENGFFDETFLHADTDLFIRLLKDEGDFGFVHQVLTFTRVHDAAVSNYAHLIGSASIEYLAMLMKHGPDFLSEPERRKLVRAYQRDYCRCLFLGLVKVWNRQIWKHQVASSRKLHVPISLLGIARAGLREAGRIILSPQDTARRLRREFKRIAGSR